MVTPMDVWEWLGANSDELTSLVSIVAILLAVYVAKRSPKWQYEAEYKKTIIQDVFPELTTNIRNTIDKYNRFLQGELFEYGKFPTLFDLFTSGKIEYIKIIDETLYNNLVKIKDDIYPLMDEMQRDRHDLMKILRDKWEVYLNSLENIHFDITRYASDLYEANSYHLWKENYDIFLPQSADIFNKYRNQGQGIIPPTDEQILELRRIAEVEIARIKEKVEPIEVKIKEIITDVVIPRLEEITADPF